jgi:hypothetical protein
VRRYLELLLSRWVTFMALLVALPLVLSVASVTLLQAHHASAVLWVDPPASPQTLADEIGQLVRTRDFANRIGDALVKSGAVTDSSELDRIQAGVADHLTVAQAGSHTISVGYSCERRRVCTDVLSAALSLYPDQLAKARQAQLDAAVGDLTAKVGSADNALRDSETAISDYLAQHPRASLANPIADPALDVLVRQADSNRKQATGLQDKLAQLHVAAASRSADSTSTVIDRAHIDDDGLALAAARIAGIIAISWLAAVAYLVLLARTDTIVRGPAEIERRLGVPVVATIGHLPAMEAA